MKSDGLLFQQNWRRSLSFLSSWKESCWPSWTGGMRSTLTSGNSCRTS